MDHLLAWVVVIAPSLFAIAIEVIDTQIRKHPYWRYGVVLFGLILSGLTWWQISTEAVVRQNAVKETAQEVAIETSDRVTKAVTEQYSKIVADQKKQITELQNQLTAQAKDVKIIKGSNIVTGKSPIKVEVTGAQESRHQISNIVMSSSPMQSIRSDATYCRKLIFTSEFSTNPIGLMVTFSAPIKYVDSLVTFVYKGYFRVSKDDPKQAEIVMIGYNEDVLKPERPIVVKVCAENVFEPVKLERREVVEN